MNDNDKSNLFFLLTSSESSIEKWYHAVNKDDHTYALEILKEYGRELSKLDADMDEMTTELMVESYQEGFPEAKMVLDRIMKMGV